MTIDFRHLRHVLAVAEHGSFSRAADALHLTQPALSRSIHVLEGALGAPVFERSRNGVEPTDVGRRLLLHAQAMHVATRDMMREVDLLQGLEQGELRIGAGPYGGAALVGTVIGRLHRLHPRLHVSVVVAPWKELPARLESRELDLVVVELSEIEQMEAFETMPLTVERPLLVCRPGHPLLDLPAPTVRDVLAYPLVGPALPQQAKLALATAAHPGKPVRPAQAPQLMVECDSHAVLRDVVRESDALSMMPWFMIQADIAAGVLDVVRGVDMGVIARFGVGWIRQRILSSAGRKFMELLLEYDAALAASRPDEAPAARRRPKKPLTVR